MLARRQHASKPKHRPTQPGARTARASAVPSLADAVCLAGQEPTNAPGVVPDGWLPNTRCSYPAGSRRRSELGKRSDGISRRKWTYRRSSARTRKQNAPTYEKPQATSRCRATCSTRICLCSLSKSSISPSPIQCPSLFNRAMVCRLCRWRCDVRFRTTLGAHLEYFSKASPAPFRYRNGRPDRHTSLQQETWWRRMHRPWAAHENNKQCRCRC